MLGDHFHYIKTGVVHFKSKFLEIGKYILNFALYVNDIK